jgi:hypothetical protein
MFTVIDAGVLTFLKPGFIFLPSAIFLVQKMWTLQIFVQWCFRNQL